MKEDKVLEKAIRNLEDVELNAIPVEKCKEWWENKVADGYFTAYSFGLSRGDMISAENLSKDSFILEIGCGYGRETKPLCEISDNVYGIDISDSALELTKKHVPTVNTKSYDGLNVPFENDMFDFIYSCFVMQHMAKKSVRILLKDALRTLKPTGHMLIEFYQCDRNKTDRDWMSGGVEGMYNNSFSLNDIENIFKEIGGKIVEINSVNHGCLANEAQPTYNHWVLAGKQ